MPHRSTAVAVSRAPSTPPPILPHNPMGVAVILSPLDPEAGDATLSTNWADFEAYLLSGLREHWWPVRDEIDNNTEIIARSPLHVLTLTFDSAGDTHVGVARRAGLSGDQETVAVRTLDTTAALIFERLARRWPLRIRTGPCSTAPWRYAETTNSADADPQRRAPRRRRGVSSHSTTLHRS